MQQISRYISYPKYFIFGTKHYLIFNLIINFVLYQSQGIRICMLLQPSDTLQIRYFETNFSELNNRPIRLEYGIYMAVVSGSAILDTGTDTYHLISQMELSFISGSIIRCSNRSEDLCVRVFTYTFELLTQISLPIDHIYFDYNEAHPTYIHTPDKRSQRTWRELLLWMDIAKMLFADGTNLKFQGMQEKTFLQGFWMWNFGTIQERIEPDAGFSNTQLIAHRFIRMVKTEAVSHHRADYYADKLNITQRYLNKIILQHTCKRTPKQLIDTQLIAEIKEKLLDTTLSIAQLAYLLNFPDQSYLSRFFRRHTGMSPAQYRQKSYASRNT